MSVQYSQKDQMVYSLMKKHHSNHYRYRNGSPLHLDMNAVFAVIRSWIDEDSKGFLLSQPTGMFSEYKEWRKSMLTWWLPKVSAPEVTMAELRSGEPHIPAFMNPEVTLAVWMLSGDWRNRDVIDDHSVNIIDCFWAASSSGFWRGANFTNKGWVRRFVKPKMFPPVDVPEDMNLIFHEDHIAAALQKEIREAEEAFAAEYSKRQEEDIVQSDIESSGNGLDRCSEGKASDVTFPKAEPSHSSNEETALHSESGVLMQLTNRELRQKLLEEMQDRKNDISHRDKQIDRLKQMNSVLRREIADTNAEIQKLRQSVPALRQQDSTPNRNSEARAQLATWQVKKRAQVRVKKEDVENAELLHRVSGLKSRVTKRASVAK